MSSPAFPIRHTFFTNARAEIQPFSDPNNASDNSDSDSSDSDNSDNKSNPEYPILRQRTPSDTTQSEPKIDWRIMICALFFV